MTAAKTPQQDEVDVTNPKAKKRVTFDIAAIEGKLDKPFLHSTSDATRDTIKQGNAAINAEDDSEDESSFEECANPYKRRKIEQHGYEFTQRGYGADAKFQEKISSSKTCQRLILILSGAIEEQRALNNHLDERNLKTKSLLPPNLPEVLNVFTSHINRWNIGKRELVRSLKTL